jgi:hypothetical protein
VALELHHEETLAVREWKTCSMLWREVGLPKVRVEEAKADPIVHVPLAGGNVAPDDATLVWQRPSRLVMHGDGPLNETPYVRDNKPR